MDIVIVRLVFEIRRKLLLGDLGISKKCCIRCNKIMKNDFSSSRRMRKITNYHWWHATVSSRLGTNHSYLINLSFDLYLLTAIFQDLLLVLPGQSFQIFLYEGLLQLSSSSLSCVLHAAFHLTEILLSSS